jgi:hypothetical protein
VPSTTCFGSAGANCHNLTNRVHPGTQPGCVPRGRRVGDVGARCKLAVYCNRRLEDLFHRQSRETDQQRRKELVWGIDTTLQEEGARPVIFHTRGATCWHPRVKDLTTMINSIYNGWRMEDVWLDK